jgi:hypothetical protein
VSNLKAILKKVTIMQLKVIAAPLGRFGSLKNLHILKLGKKWRLRLTLLGNLDEYVAA